MKPAEFEYLVAEYFRNKGFSTEKTPTTRDFGVDIFATNNKEKIAIQVKMYESRTVNYKDIMYLYSASKLFECTHSIMVSSGEIRQDAKEVAGKLGVEILEYFEASQTKLKQSQIEKRVKSSTKQNNIQFMKIWEEHIMPLQGQTIRTVTGKSNIIERVNLDGITRISSTGRKSNVGIEIFQWTFEQLIDKGKLSRDEINQHYVNRASAVIFAVFSTLPFVDITLDPATLHYLK